MPASRSAFTLARHSFPVKVSSCYFTCVRCVEMQVVCEYPEAETAVL